MPSLNGGCSEFGGVSPQVPSPTMSRFGVCKLICNHVAASLDSSHLDTEKFFKLQKNTKAQPFRLCLRVCVVRLLGRSLCYAARAMRFGTVCLVVTVDLTGVENA